jgi:hypothetical protein
MYFGNGAIRTSVDGREEYFLPFEVKSQKVFDFLKSEEQNPVLLSSQQALAVVSEMNRKRDFRPLYVCIPKGDEYDQILYEDLE